MNGHRGWGGKRKNESNGGLDWVCCGFFFFLSALRASGYAKISILLLMLMRVYCDILGGKARE